MLIASIRKSDASRHSLRLRRCGPRALPSQNKRLVSGIPTIHRRPFFSALGCACMTPTEHLVCAPSRKQLGRLFRQQQKFGHQRRKPQPAALSGRPHGVPDGGPKNVHEGAGALMHLDFFVRPPYWRRRANDWTEAIQSQAGVEDRRLCRCVVSSPTDLNVFVSFLFVNSWCGRVWECCVNCASQNVLSFNS